MKKIILKTSSVLWVIWGLVHIFAGILTMKGYLTGDITSSVSGIADAIDRTLLQMDYPQALGAILAQHGFNLFWIGLVTTIAGIYIWNKNTTAIFVAALVGGLADLGYLIFMDLGGFVRFVPGTIMTIISFSAIILSFYVYFKSNKLQNLN